MALKRIQVYVMLSITLLVSDSLLTENAQARVQALSFISFGVKTPAIHSGDIDTALLERTKHRKIDLTYGLKSSIIKVSSWQTCIALPLGSVSAYPLYRG